MTNKQLVLLMLTFAFIQGATNYGMRNYVPQKWEYRTTYLHARHDGLYYGLDLQEAGHEGWELVSVVPEGKDKQVCVFKRPAH